MKKGLRLLAGCYLAYVAISILIITPVLNFLPPWFIEQQYQRKFSTELTYFNPFTLKVEAHDARLSEVDGSPFAGIERTAVNLSVAGLWHSGWVFDELAIEGIELHLRRYVDGHLNIDNLLASSDEPVQKTEAAVTEPAPARIPGVTIDQIRLSAHRIEVSDAARKTPYNTHWDDLKLHLSDISTVVNTGRHQHLELLDEDRGKLSWEGELSIPDSRSSGRIELAQISLKPGWRFVQDELDLKIADGSLQAGLNYEVSWADTFNFRIDQGELMLSNIDIAPAAGVNLPDTGIKLASLRLAGIAVDGSTEQVDIKRLDIDGLAVSGWMDEERISLTELFNTRFPPSDDNNKEPSPWHVTLHEANLNAAAFHWRSPFTEPATLAVTPINLRADNINWPAQNSTQLALDLAVNDSAQLNISGELNIGSGDGTLRYKVQSLPLALFAPNLPAALNARVDDGRAEANGQLVLTGFGPTQVSSEGAIRQFAMRLYETEQSLTGWQTLEWEKLNINLQQQHVELGQLLLDGYVGTLHIREDGSLNIQHVMREEATAQARTETTTPAAESSTEESATAPWTYNLPSFIISDSALDFSDESLPIKFRTVIGDLDGEITGFNSDPTSITSVDLKGSVDAYAPVRLAGTVSPLRSPPALDLGLSFKGVDLARLTPYSGTYAGHAISRGTLNLNVKYNLQENRLKGDNKVVIKQLKLGEKIDSEKAVNLPLELGIALLSDANGVIDLDVPVSGDVSSPSFSLGGVIWGAFTNLITKAVTAPFRLLASLAGSEDDLQYINFGAGSSEADDATRNKLQELAQALGQRPQLKLVITGRIDPDSDQAKLQSLTLRQSLLDEGLSESDISERSDRWKAAVAERYARLPEHEAIEGSEPPSAVQQARRLARQIQIPEKALKDLAEERAAAAKRYLVTEAGIEADRAVIEQSDPTAKGNTFSGVEMSIDV